MTPTHSDLFSVYPGLDPGPHLAKLNDREVHDYWIRAR